MFERTWNPAIAATAKSLLLLGPRQTGKSTLLRSRLPNATYIDLLDSKTHRQLQSAPERLFDILLRTTANVAIVDEVQRIPELTNEVQRVLFERPKLRVILTGSSARKLKKAGVNLLGGRLRRQLLCPITSEELAASKTSLTVDDLIGLGGLPSVLLSNTPEQELNDYVETYLKEEIQQEAQVRKLGQFTRFLNIAALSVGQQIIFSNVASDAEVPASTVRDYFQLLEDTLVGHLLPCFGETKKRKAFVAPKFYFFDVGVANVLRETVGVSPTHPAFGVALEHFAFCELLSWKSYHQPSAELFYWRSLSQHEVDFVIRLSGRYVGIEVKSSNNITGKHSKALHALEEDLPGLTKAVVCRERHPRTTTDGVEIIPFAQLQEWLARTVTRITATN